MALSEAQQALLLQNQPDSVNPILDIGFRLIIPDLKHVNYFANTIKLPGMRSTVVDQSTGANNIKRPGQALDYDYLSVTFLVDNKLTNYFEIYDWIFRNTSPTGAKEANYPRKQTDIFKDIQLLILNNKSNLTAEIRFYNSIPVSLSSIKFITKDQEGTYLEATVEFAFTYFKKE